MIGVLLILDQVTKYLAYYFQPNFNILGHFFRMQYIENTGTIFGLFQNANIVFTILAIILCVIIVFYIVQKTEKKSAIRYAMMLILAGGLGNLIDRIWRGFVVDFISLKWVGIFNLADSYVVIGVGIILFLEVKEYIQQHRS